MFKREPGVAQWLRNCATSRAVPGSVTGIFLVDTDRTMCPGVNSASKKWVPGITLEVKAVGAWGWRPTTLVVPNVKKSGALTCPDPLGHLDGLLWERPLPLPISYNIEYRIYHIIYNIIYHIISYISYHISYHILYHISYHIFKHAKITSF